MNTIPTICAICVTGCVLVGADAGHARADESLAESRSTQPAAVAETVRIRVPGTTVSFEVVRCPPGEDTDGNPIPELWTLTTEVPWELYDIYVYALDAGEDEGADAIARPSKPYVPPDRGFGHEGYPAISMTRGAAEGFCEWLSTKTGVPFRLPSAPEWSHLASAGGAAFDPDESDEVDAVAWTKANAEFTTHPVSQKQPNGFGLFDVYGNVGEWVMTDTRRPIAMGGSFRDPPEACHATASQQQARNWNASDPQIPKSRWWLADCSWVGFRFVTEQDPTEVSDGDE